MSVLNWMAECVMGKRKGKGKREGAMLTLIRFCGVGADPREIKTVGISHSCATYMCYLLEMSTVAQLCSQQDMII